jgi:hypothetical protein
LAATPLERDPVTVDKKAGSKKGKLRSGNRYQSDSNVILGSVKHGDAHIATYGVLLYGLSAMVPEVHALSATIAAICTSETRSCRLGPKTCSITSDPVMRSKYTVHSGRTILIGLGSTHSLKSHPDHHCSCPRYSACWRYPYSGRIVAFISEAFLVVLFLV